MKDMQPIMELTHKLRQATDSNVSHFGASQTPVLGQIQCPDPPLYLPETAPDSDLT